jgi:hypothetical protein
MKAAYRERIQPTTIIKFGDNRAKSKNLLVPSYQCLQKAVTTIVRPFDALMIYFAHWGVPRDIYVLHLLLKLRL